LVGVAVFVGVLVIVEVAVRVGVAVEVLVFVGVDVLVGVRVIVGVNVRVGVTEGVDKGDGEATSCPGIAVGEMAAAITLQSTPHPESPSHSSPTSTLLFPQNEASREAATSESI